MGSDSVRPNSFQGYEAEAARQQEQKESGAVVSVVTPVGPDPARTQPPVVANAVVRRAIDKTGCVDITAGRANQIVAGVSPTYQPQWPVGPGLLRHTLANRTEGGVRHAGPSYERLYADFAKRHHDFASFKYGGPTRRPIKPPWAATLAGCERQRASLQQKHANIHTVDDRAIYRQGVCKSRRIV